MTDPAQATVLLVEDNMDNMFVVVEMLRYDVGVHFIDAVMTGFELFNLLVNKPELQPDLILLDIQIPGEDGYGVLQRIRRHPQIGSARVVAVTANVMSQDVAKARQAGFDGFIGKPLNARRFPEQIRRVLQGEGVWEAR